MNRIETIYQDGSHRWLAIARDPQRPGYVVDTNEYLVLHEGQGLLCDPGGLEIFPSVFSAICTQCDPACITTIFASHQDPDIISSLSLWLDFNPQLRCHISWLWTSFITHFGGDDRTIVPIPDEGTTLSLAGLPLRAVPAHYLHSSGNFHLYDPKARVLFSGDIGAALLPGTGSHLFVEDFDTHILHARDFHQRWMGSQRAKLDWCERVARLDIDMLCPQHGAIYRGADVQRFINWFAELEVGVLRQG